MSWLKKYRARLYLRNSIWIFAAVGIVTGLLAVTLVSRFELSLGFTPSISRETARAIIGTVAASMFSLIVMVNSAVLLAVQLASAQLTPRIIAFVYRSNVWKLSFAVFLFTFTFCVGVLVRIDNAVPLTGYIAAYGFLVNLGLFLYFIDGIGKTLRPSSALRSVGLQGRRVIRSVYPFPLEPKTLATDEPLDLNEPPSRVVPNAFDGAVLAFDPKGLVSLAKRSDCLIELVPQVGDFVAVGDPLFRVFRGGGDITDRALRNSVALGQERTLDQDPMFAFRIIVDIASKALSPAINDPTTAVLAIDQIHHLLRDVGGRNLEEGRETDKEGVVRVVFRTPNWEDFVSLAVTELRHYGRESVQVMRRLRAMLENLMETLPDRRVPLLRKELDLLVASAERMFPDSEDQLLAETSDSQGLGGSQYGRHRFGGE